MLHEISNRFLESWADRVAGYIARLDKAFYIPWQETSLRWSTQRDTLHVWLLAAAIARVNKDKRGRANRDAVGALLGLPKRAVASQLKRWERNPPSTTNSELWVSVKKALETQKPRGRPSS
jgi:hypothetical protein